MYLHVHACIGVRVAAVEVDLLAEVELVCLGVQSHQVDDAFEAVKR